MTVTEQGGYLALRVEVGKFCMWNCLQEAVFPVLGHIYEFEKSDFDFLRFVRWQEVADALSGGTSASGFGGVKWRDLTDLYQIGWEGASEPVKSFILENIPSRPVLARVDRYHLPSDEKWFHKTHLPHWILIVRADQKNLAYIDADYASTPAPLDWGAFGDAILEGPADLDLGAVVIVDAQDLSDSKRISIRRRFVRGLVQCLQEDPAVVHGVLGEVLRLMRGVLPDISPGEHSSWHERQDAAAFLNSIRQSIKAAKSLLVPQESDLRLFLTFCERFSAQFESSYLLYFMVNAKPTSARWSRLKSAFLTLGELWESDQHRIATEQLAHWAKNLDRRDDILVTP